MIFGGRKGTAFFFSLKECVFFLNHKFTISARFCQNLYVYSILGVARGPCQRKFGIFGGLNMHNCRPFLV